MDQDIYDAIVLLVLETISSYEYLNSIGIYRPEKVNWNVFKKQLTDQTIKPGIYPKSYGKNAVHYYSVRYDHKLDKMIAANSYDNVGTLNENYAIALNVQEDATHGLCQTFALMYYLGKEGLLKKGTKHYYSNIKIGLNFLYDFIMSEYEQRERCWDDIVDVLDNMDIDSKYRNKIGSYLYTVSENDGMICLSSLLKIMMVNTKFLKTWYYD